MNVSDSRRNSGARRFQSLRTLGRESAANDNALLNHLDIAFGSQGEVEVQLDLAQRLGFVSQRDVQPIAERVAEVGRMLNGLIEALQPKEVELE
jgi:four helix bundle protein